MQKLLILDNIRSLHNVGSLLRTADGCGIDTIFACGITPYPELINDTRLPHIREKATRHIHKTALGAEENLSIYYFETTSQAIQSARDSGIKLIYGLEQTQQSRHPQNTTASPTWALVVGNEVDGMNANTLSSCDELIEIPMLGKKESFNVHVATSMVLYELCLR